MRFFVDPHPRPRPNPNARGNSCDMYNHNHNDNARSAGAQQRAFARCGARVASIWGQGNKRGDAQQTKPFFVLNASPLTRTQCPNPNATPSRTQPLTSSSRLIRSIGSSASAKTSSFDPRNNAHSPDAAHASPQSGGKGTGKGIRNKQSNGREFMLRVHAEGTCREMLVEGPMIFIVE